MIPINLIRQYFFCPRIIYFNLLTNIKPVYPLHVEIGKEYHNLQYKLTKHRKFKKLNINYHKVLKEYYIEDEELGVNGKVDLVFVCNDEIIPVEFKFIEKKPSYAYMLQVIGYGILLERRYNLEFKRGFIIYSNNIKFYPINVTKTLKDDFFKTIEKIKNIIDKGNLPFSSASENKCSQCEYLNFCDDRI